MVVAARLPPSAHVLDLGCGEGRNALYLADLGFQTTAIDISRSGIEKVLTVADERGLRVNASVCDMRDYGFPRPFDLIVCQGCLHLICRNEWEALLERMKTKTPNAGFHVVGVFTDTVPEPEDQRGLMVGLFKEGGLLEHYRDWELLDWASSVFDHEHPGGIRHKHAANRVTARRP